MVPADRPNVPKLTKAQTQVILEGIEDTETMLVQIEALEEAGLDMTEARKIANTALAQSKTIRKAFIDPKSP